jgi:YidC/Oxa1 family membrane protein insertase
MIGDHLNLLPILATAAMFLQQRLAPAYGTALTEEQKIQQKIFRFFPVFLLVILYNSPAGFMLYWTVNSVLMLGQQLILTKKGRPIPAK